MPDKAIRLAKDLAILSMQLLFNLLIALGFWLATYHNSQHKNEALVHMMIVHSAIIYPPMKGGLALSLWDNDSSLAC